MHKHMRVEENSNLRRFDSLEVGVTYANDVLEKRSTLASVKQATSWEW